MFTGIITAIGHVRAVSPLGESRDMRLTIGAPAAFLAAQGGTALGASIACSGCCLTATELGPDWFAIDVSAETLDRTAIGQWAPGTAINLERSLRLGDELGGHLVSGHVDGVGRIATVTQENGSLRLTIEVPPPLHRYIAQKGSVAVDGVSLTVNETSPPPRDGQNAPPRFGVNIIPHTAAHTTLGLRAPGDAVQIEIDTLARYVARLAETA
jgi:riboflavin synthase